VIVLLVAILFNLNTQCNTFWVTGYVRQVPPMNPVTRDGTSIFTYEDIVATDPSVIPLQSRLTIEGYNTIFRAADTGGGIKGNRVDIAVWTLREAYDATGNRQVCWWTR
jgi:3D (Asp-Asp-Asp) domain-containing protein